MNRTEIINKVLNHANMMQLPEFNVPNYFYNQKAFNEHIKELYGNEAFKISKFLWKNGYLKINAYGYVNVSRRGYTLLFDKKETPRTQKREKPTIEQTLDYLFEHNKERFEKWLKTKGLN